MLKLFLHANISVCCFILRLSQERISELQQHVEELQKALQSQAAKPDDVRVPICTVSTNRVTVQSETELEKKGKLIENFSWLRIFVGGGS